MKVQRVDIDSLNPYPGNPRRGDIDAIAHSIEANGVYKPIVVQKDTNYILAGNHTWQAAKKLGHSQIDVVWAEVDEATALRILLVDNASNDKATYDWPELKLMLDDLDDLSGTGYTAADLEDITAKTLEELAALDEADGDDDRAATTGELLDLVDVSVGEPQHKVKQGEVWKLGHHTLVVAKVMDEHHLWRSYLTDEVKFAPYPEPYFTTTDVARDNALLLIQPNPYLAGHLLDKHSSAFGADTVKKVK